MRLAMIRILAIVSCIPLCDFRNVLLKIGQHAKDIDCIGLIF